MVRVRRSELKGAAYNPRSISAEAARRLRENLRKRGLLGPAIVVNRPTMTVIAGHKRLELLDLLEQGADYYIDVTMVELTPKEEREQNVFMNNTSTQGEFDLALFEQLLKEPEIKLEPEGMGFDILELEDLLGPEAIGSLVPPPSEEQKEASKSAAEVAAEIAAIKAAKKEAAAQSRAEQATVHATIVWKSWEAKEEFMRHLGKQPEEMWLDGEMVFEHIAG